MTGVDPMGMIRGRYCTAIGAARVLKEFAGGGLEEAAAKIAISLRAPEISALTASRGDCVLAEVDTGSGYGPALGLVSLSARAALFAGPTGLTEISLRNCRRAWRV